MNESVTCDPTTYIYIQLLKSESIWRLCVWWQLSEMAWGYGDLTSPGSVYDGCFGEKPPRQLHASIIQKEAGSTQ